VVSVTVDGYVDDSENLIILAFFLQLLSVYHSVLEDYIFDLEHIWVLILHLSVFILV